MSYLDDSIDQVRATAAALGREGQQVRVRRRKLAGKPPERNLKIFKAVMIEHRKHDEAARMFGLHRSRISQIVKRMCLDLAEAAPDDPEIKEFVARQRLDKRLDQMRLEYVLEETARALREEPRQLAARRQGSRIAGEKTETWEEVTTREQTQSVQLLKTFLRTAEAIRKLREELAPDEPPRKLTDIELFEAINLIFENWLSRVQFEPDPPSHEFLLLMGQFRAQMFSWVLERKKGTPRALAWPTDNYQRGIGSRLFESHSRSANMAHHNAPEINPDWPESPAQVMDANAGSPDTCDPLSAATSPAIGPG